MKKKGIKYFGEVVSVPGNDGYGFIGIQTVTTEKGLPAELPTTEDIFLHQDDCGSQIRVGMHVTFYVGEDRHRGEGRLRAFGAIEFIEAELVSSGEPPVPGFYAMTQPAGGGQLAEMPPRSAYHLGVKDVPEEAVEKVLENEPMPGIPRNCQEFSDEQKLQLLAAMLKLFFPFFELFGANFNILHMTNEELDQAVEENENNLKALGLDQQIEDIKKEVKRFKGMKDTFKLIYEDGLVRPDTIIPIKYLPDLFMAVPVWYFWVKPTEIKKVEEIWRNQDPKPQEEIRYFCDLFFNERWTHTYQLFNRRMRSLKMFNGDKIPPFVSRRLCKAVEAFDYIVIATPYHEEAGKDWQDINWLHLIDPYVLGFKKGIPFFFILARFSDSGTFPLYPEMVADTINFLKSNKEKISGFGSVDRPYWYKNGKPENCESSLGGILQRHVDCLIAAFERGELFDWLRDEKNVES